MTAPPRRTSNLRLALFLAAVVALPVVLVAGPFRDRFFPQQARAIAALAAPVEPPVTRGDLERLLGAELAAALQRDLEPAVAARDWAALARVLERVEPARATSGVRYLHGVAWLAAGHPALALTGLQDAAATATAPLQDDARFALAQALLRLARGDEAARTLTALDVAAGPFAERARGQLAALAELK
jgi:hypothetical protein